MSTQPGMQTHLQVPYEEAIQQVTDALSQEGFGILTKIDIQDTFKQKIDVDFRRYVILGACSPPLAHRALSSNLDVGLLLPCNVIVYEEGDGSIVSIIDPLVMLDIIPDNEEVKAVASEAQAKLKRVLASLS